MEQKISMGEAVSYGWNVFKKKGWFLVGITLIYIIASSISAPFRNEDNTTWWGVAYVLSIIVGTIFEIGIINIVLKLTLKDGNATFGDLFEKINLFFRFLGASLLYGFITFIGLLLLIVPGIILGIKFQFVPYLVVDKNVGILEAFRMSSDMTDGKKWMLFEFGLLLLVINILGIIALIIGTFVTIPLTMVAKAQMYRQLLPMIKAKEQAIEA